MLYLDEVLFLPQGFTAAELASGVAEALALLVSTDRLVVGQHVYCETHGSGVLRRSRVGAQ